MSHLGLLLPQPAVIIRSQGLYSSAASSREREPTLLRSMEISDPLINRSCTWEKSDLLFPADNTVVSLFICKAARELFSISPTEHYMHFSMR